MLNMKFETIRLSNSNELYDLFIFILLVDLKLSSVDDSVMIEPSPTPVVPLVDVVVSKSNHILTT